MKRWSEERHEGCDYLAGRTSKGDLFCNKCGFFKAGTGPMRPKMIFLGILLLLIVALLLS